MITLSRLLLGASMLVLVFAASRFFLLRKSAPFSKRLLILTGEFVLVVLLMELARRLEAGLAVFPSGLLVNTLQVFSLDFDYSSVLPDEKLISPGLANSLLTWYRGLVYSLAPVVGGAVILDVLAGISPEVQMFFSRKRKLYVFSELNELSVTLAEDVCKNRGDLGNPVIVFTDCYVDEARETDSELLNRARALHAICLRDEISSSHRFASSDDSCFFLMDLDDSREFDDRSNLSAFLSMVGGKELTDKRIENKRKIDKETQEAKEKNRDNRKIDKETQEAKEQYSDKKEKIEEAREYKKDWVWNLKKKNNVYFFSNNDDANDSFRAVASPWLKVKNMPYFHVVRDYALSSFYQLSRVPLYSSLDPANSEKEEGKPVRVALFGDSIFAREMFRTVFSIGQMWGHPLEIAVMYKPHDGQRQNPTVFENYLNQLSPEILESCTPDSEILRLAIEGDDYSIPYASLCFIEEDPNKQNTADLLKTTRFFFYDKSGQNGFTLADCDYFLVMAGSDEENLSLADSLRRSLNALGKTNKSISFLAENNDVGDISSLRMMEEGFDASLKMYSFGRLKDRFSWERVARNGDNLNERYASVFAVEVMPHGDDSFPETTNALYNDWSRIARAFHLQYKMFCAGVNPNGTESKSPLLNSAKAKVKYAERISQSAELTDNLCWMEHRRWCAFTRTLGFTQPTGLLDYLKETAEYKSIGNSANQNDRLRTYTLKNVPARLHPCLVESRHFCTDENQKDLLDMVSRLRVFHDKNTDEKLSSPKNNGTREINDYCYLKRDDAPLDKNRVCFSLQELAVYLGGDKCQNKKNLEKPIQLFLQSEKLYDPETGSFGRIKKKIIDRQSPRIAYLYLEKRRKVPYRKLKTAMERQFPKIKEEKCVKEKTSNLYYVEKINEIIQERH